MSMIYKGLGSITNSIQDFFNGMSNAWLTVLIISLTLAGLEV